VDEEEMIHIDPAQGETQDFRTRNSGMMIFEKEDTNFDV